MRRTLRYLGIAVTALSLTACVLLIALWVRSYYSPVQLKFVSQPEPSVKRFTTLSSWKGTLWYRHLDYYGPTQNSSGRSTSISSLPILLVLLTLAGLPWVQVAKNFSLRTLLIATTLVAVGLAAIVYASR